MTAAEQTRSTDALDGDRGDRDNQGG